MLITTLSVAQTYSSAYEPMQPADPLPASESQQSDQPTAFAPFQSVENRFQSALANLALDEWSVLTRSRITDTNFAAETSTMTKSQILQQAGVAMLSQANSASQTVLALVGR